jgi:UDP:flavonoid glycosyltransferase YjiC (YdhE family)
MKSLTIAFISPSTYSDHLAMMAFAKVFAQKGCRVIVACNQQLAHTVQSHGMEHYALNLSPSRKIASKSTKHIPTETEICEILVEKSKIGLVETLTYLTKIQMDLIALPDGKSLIESIAQMRDEIHPNYWVIDQNSAISRIAMEALQLPFIAFCSGHPTSIPLQKGIFGVPPYWPKGMKPSKDNLRILKKSGRALHKRLNRRFNQLLRRVDKSLDKVDDTIRHTSRKAVIFNYPNFGHLHYRHIDTHSIFMGAGVVESSLIPRWQNRLRSIASHSPRILISFGTLFSNRTDIIEKCILAVKRQYPNAAIIATAGAQHQTLQHLQSESVIIDKFIPQSGVLPFVDLVIHHGGVNTFAETLFFAKPMVILPFTGEQISVAFDAEYMKLGQVVNPYNLNTQTLQEKITLAYESADYWLLDFWRQRIRSAGPEYAVEQLHLFDNHPVPSLQEAICA